MGILSSTSEQKDRGCVAYPLESRVLFVQNEEVRLLGKLSGHFQILSQ